MCATLLVRNSTIVSFDYYDIIIIIIQLGRCGHVFKGRVLGTNFFLKKTKVLDWFFLKKTKVLELIFLKWVLILEPQIYAKNRHWGISIRHSITGSRWRGQRSQKKGWSVWHLLFVTILFGCDHNHMLVCCFISFWHIYYAHILWQHTNWYTAYKHCLHIWTRGSKISIEH